MAMMHNPSHPGRILAAYMSGYTVKEVAEHLGVTRTALPSVSVLRAPRATEPTATSAR